MLFLCEDPPVYSRGSSAVHYSESMKFEFPSIYPILDSALIPTADRERFLRELGESLADAGVALLEYRNKTNSDAEVLADAAILRAAMPPANTRLILDDRVHLVEAAGFDGVHVDAGDLTPVEARSRLGPNRIIGTFGGSESLLPDILNEPADYLSIGPVDRTTTKQTTKPPIGIEGVRRLRQQAGPRPVLIAVGGVTLQTAPSILAAGATTVAVAAAIFQAADPAAEFRRWKAALG